MKSRLPGSCEEWSELWDALKSFILTSLKIKVAPSVAGHLKFLLSFQNNSSRKLQEFSPSPFQVIYNGQTVRSGSTLQLRWPGCHFRSSPGTYHVNTKHHVSWACAPKFGNCITLEGRPWNVKTSLREDASITACVLEKVNVTPFWYLAKAYWHARAMNYVISKKSC